MARLNSTELIIISLMILTVPGILYNNLNASALTVSPSAAIACSTDPNYPICQYPSNVPILNPQGGTGAGCQNTGGVNTHICTLSGSSVSFLNGNSPFTQLLQGDVFGLFSTINGPGYQGPGAQYSITGGHGPFDAAGGGTFYQVNCFGRNATASLSQRNWAITGCTQTGTDNANLTEAQSQGSRFSNWNTIFAPGGNLYATLYHFQGNGSTFLSCTWMGNINYTAIANGPGFLYFGCDMALTGSYPNPPDLTLWSVLIAMPNCAGCITGHDQHEFLYAQPENWDTYQCFPSQVSATFRIFNSAGCTNFYQQFKGISLGCSGSTCSSFVPSLTGIAGATPLLTFILGLVLIVGGLGIGGTLGPVGFSVDDQGAKLLQTVGIGLIVWSFLFSEFSTWFTSGLLPFGFDGAFGIVSIAVSGMFFFGLYWRTQSYD